MLEGFSELFQIRNDVGLEMYLVKTEGGFGNSVRVFGTTKNGKWVKYFNTYDASRTYKLKRDSYIYNFYCSGNAIIFEVGSGEYKKDCELIYRWNDSAQWFGVEFVPY